MNMVRLKCNVLMKKYLLLYPFFGGGTKRCVMQKYVLCTIFRDIYFTNAS